MPRVATGLYILPPKGARKRHRAKLRDVEGKWITPSIPDVDERGLPIKNDRDRERYARGMFAKFEEQRLLRKHGLVKPEPANTEEARALARGRAVTLKQAKADYFAETKSHTSGSEVTYSIAIDEFINFVGRKANDLGANLTPPDCAKRYRAKAYREPTVADVTPDILKAWRRKVISKPPVSTRNERSPDTVSRELRNVGAMVRHHRDENDLFEHLSDKEVRRAFRKVKTPAAKKPTKKPHLRRDAIRSMLEAAIAYDADPNRRRAPVAAVFLLVLMFGFRLHEIIPGSERLKHCAMRWEGVRLDVRDGVGRRTGYVSVHKEAKTGARDVNLRYSPAAIRLLTALKIRAGGSRASGPVFADVGKQDVAAAYRALRKVKDYPQDGTLQACRRTSETFIANSRLMAWAQMLALFGHDDSTALANYIGSEDVDQDARSIEALMGIEDLAQMIIDAVTSTHPGERQASSS